LRRFSARFGVHALVDTDSRVYRDQGLAYLSTDEQGLLERLLRDNSLVRLPLVRAGDRLTVGVDEGAWRRWLTEERAAT
jgi:arsenate reductase-like glutaredoxin family protein